MGSPFRFSGLPSWAVPGLMSGLSLCLGFGCVVGLSHYGAARPVLVSEQLPVAPKGPWIAPFVTPTLWMTSEVISPREQPRWVF